jgi:steroid delta-isomerase-like uncharacterized protein
MSEAIMRRWFDEVWNHGNYQVVRDVMLPDAIGYGQSDQQESIVGPEQFIALAERIRSAFPDFHLTVDDIFSAGDRVVVRWSAVMTHTGDALGLAPTHRRVKTYGITIVHFRDGKLSAGWDCWDQAGLMKQLTSSQEAAA